MITFLSPNELSYAIFSYKLDDRNQYSNLRPCIKELIPKGKFPLVNFKKFQEDHKNKIDFLISLKKNDFSFPFNADCFTHIFKPNTFSFPETTQSPDYFTLFILYSYLGWYLNFIQKHDTKYVEIILQALLVIMDIKTCKVVTKSRVLAASAFLHIYSETVESSDLLDVTKLYPPLVQYLTMNNDLSEAAFDLLLKLGNRVINKSSKTFTAETSQFCNFVVMIIRTCGNRLPSYVSNVIVSLMTSSLLGLDKDALSFFGRSLDTLGVDTADSIIKEIPNSILQFIQNQQSPVIEFDKSAKNDALVFPPREISIENISIDNPSFQQDINELFQPIPSFPPVLPIKQIINPDLLEILNLILKIVENKDKLKQILLISINDILIGREISNYYYDIFASFLYLLLLLYPNEPFLPFQSDLFLSRLFNQNCTIFNQISNFSTIYTVRHLAFLLLFQQNPDVINSSIKVIRLKPYIFAEFLYKILSEINHIDDFLEKCSPLFGGVVSAISFYHFFQDVSDEFTQMSAGARIAGFTFLNELLKIDDYFIIFFNSNKCIDHLFSWMYDRPIRKWALAQILQAFKINHPNSPYLIDSLQPFINKTFHFGYAKEEILQGECIINFLNNEYFNSNSDIIMPILKPNISLICRWITGMPKYVMVKQQGAISSSYSGGIPLINIKEAKLQPKSPHEPKSTKRSPRNKHVKKLINKSFSSYSPENTSDENNSNQNLILQSPHDTDHQFDFDQVFVNVYEYGSQLFLTVLNALASFSSVYLFSQSDFSAVETAVTVLYRDHPSDMFFDKLCCVVSGQYLKEIQPSFVIKQPKLAKLFISSYENSDNLKTKAEFIESLCNFNSVNCVQLEKGAFDLFLIDRLTKYRNDYSFSKDVYDIYLRIIRLISAEASSVAIVHQYLSLLCSINHDYLPRFYPNILNNLQQQLQASRKLPATPLPIFTATQVTAHNVQIPQSFSIFFWFFVTNLEFENPITVFSILNESTSFFVNLEDSKFICYYQHKNEQWATDLKYQVVPNQWCLATFSVFTSLESNGTVVRPAFNGEKIQSGVFPCFDLSNNTSKVIVGKTQNDKFHLFLGSFGITPYFDSSENISMFDTGPRKIPSKPLFFFGIRDKNDDFALDVLPENIEYQFQKVRTLHKPSFTDLLIDVCGISSLVPILNQIDFTFSNGESLPFLLDTFVEILEMSLTLSYNAQVLFSSDKCFLLISHLLIHERSSNLTYKVFLRFCSILELLDDEKCRYQLYFGILIRLHIWIRADPIHLKKILRYWYSSLIPLNLELTLKRITFCDVLSSLNLFLPYEINEQTLSFDRQIYNYDDIKACREQLGLIAVMLASEGIDSQQFKYLIVQILKIGEELQVIDLLNLLDKLIDQHEKVRSKSKYAMDPIIYLMFLYSTNTEIIELAMNAVIKGYKLSLINKMTLSQYADAMMPKLPGCYARLPVIRKLMKICENQAGHLFSLCAMITVSLGSKYFAELLDTMKPNVGYCGNQFWSLWPVIALYRFEGNLLKSKIIQYLIDVSPSQWKNVFWMIDNVGRILNENSDLLKKRFIAEIVKKVGNLPEYDELIFHQFFYLIPQYLFLQTKRIAYELLFPSISTAEKKKIPIRHSFIPHVAHRGPSLSTTSDSSDFSEEEEEEEEKRLYFSPAKTTPIKPSIQIPLPHTLGRTTPLSRSPISGNSGFFSRRRSSFHSFESLHSVNQNETFESLNSVTFKLSDVLIKLKSTIQEKNIHLYFGLRIDDDHHWTDEDIVIGVNNIFKKYPHAAYYNPICFINSFLLHFNKDAAVSIIDRLKLAKLQSGSPEISLYNKHAHQMSVKQLTDETPSTFQNSSAAFLKHFESAYHPNRPLFDLLKHLEQTNEVSNKLHSEYETTFAQILRENSNSAIDAINSRNTKYTKYWARFWKTMTMKRAPWYQSLSLETRRREEHYKRDFYLCAYFCPFKLRQNHAFQLHTDASNKRDSVPKKRLNFRRSANLSGMNLFKTMSLFNLAESTAEIFTERLDITERESNSDMKNYTTDNNSLFFESSCVVITVSHQYDAVFSLQKYSVVLSKEDQTATEIKIEAISAVLRRTYLQRETAIEIFMNDGSSFFIDFPEYSSDDIIDQFQMVKRSMQLTFLLQAQQPKQFVTFLKCSILWTSRKISNFEYLMLLNILSGRSFNDPSQYPIVPWVLSDYTSEKLDFNNPKIFRDLSKPSGALGDEKFAKLKENFDSLEYLYSSGNISPILLYLWLVRMEPFATLQIKEQNGQFDLAERQFKSIEESYQSVLNLSFDFRELIPEFFYEPEFLINNNHFDLGLVNGKPIDNVELPKWVDSSLDPYCAAYQFVYTHRKALESEYVSNHLHEWIDLIWGYKARGMEAVAANNVYLPEMYPEIWTSDFQDAPQTIITEIEDILKHIGQIPTQLFNKPHPIRQKSLDKPLDSLLSYQIELSQTPFSIGKIFFLSDKKTIGFLTIDDHGICIETHLDFQALQIAHTVSAQQIIDMISSSELRRRSAIINTNSPQNNDKKTRKLSVPKYISNLKSSKGNLEISEIINEVATNHNQPVSMANISSYEDSKPHGPQKLMWLAAFASSASDSSVFADLNGAFMISPISSISFSWITSASGNSNLWKKFFLVHQQQPSDIYLVDPNTGHSVRVVRQRSDITSMATDGLRWLAVANKDSKIRLYSLDILAKKTAANQTGDSLLKEQFSIPSFRASIRCCDISSAFQLIVCGTKDKSLMFCSLASRSLVRTVELDAKPIILLITPSWGFTVVYMRSFVEGSPIHYIALFSSNGVMIRKVSIPYAVKKMSTFKDSKGFDFVLFANDQNEIFAFEAFYCDVGNPLFQAKSNIVALSYMISTQSIVILCDDAFVHFIPKAFQ